MKITLSIICCLFAMQMLATNTPSSEERRRSQTFIAKQLSETLSFHQLSEAAFSKYAFVQVMVLPNGQLEVMNVNAHSEKLRQEICKSIEETRVDVSVVLPGQEYSFRLEFKYTGE